MGPTVIQGVLSIGALCLLFLLWFTFISHKHSDTYTLIAGICAAYIISIGTFMAYKILWKKEGFEDKGAVSDVEATVFTKESCEQLRGVLKNYQDVKAQHTSMKILNLDETIEQLQKYLSDYACSQYDS